jgi:hypothetical protein
MIFRPELANKIRAGEKTQTRRPIKPGEATCRYKVEHSYAVQTGRGKPQVARIVVTDVRQERLGDISRDDAKREGFKRKGFGDPDTFKAYWSEMHGGIDLDQLVWVISFELDRDTPRYLAPAQPGRPDYTHDRTRALDPAEVVDDMTLDQYAHDNQARFEATHQTEIGRRNLRSSMERLKRIAKAHGDHGSAAAIISRHVEQIERELDDRGEAA